MFNMVVSEAEIKTIGEVLKDSEKPLKQRFRALFTLKNLGGKEAIDCICEAFSDSSALLKHELAYCLGQMQDEYAIPFLVNVLKDTTQEPMVRHEAGEALGAIGAGSLEDLLTEYAKDPVIEVSETCELALSRIRWKEEVEREQKTIRTDSFYSTVDPAPALENTSVEALEKILLDEEKPLFDRYRAMFSLRNLGTEKAVKALCKALDCPRSALFRHEIAFVLGQLQSPHSVEALAKKLAEIQENEMVRHECAEALGSIATDKCQEVLKDYLKDEKRVVRESCEVALDISEYENSDEFQYADALHKEDL